MIDLVVFDMVGTTIKDDGVVVQAFLDTLHQHQIPATEKDLGPWRGAAKRSVLQAFVERHFGREDPANQRRVEDAYAAFRCNLEQAYEEAGARALPGVEVTFEYLRERRIKIAFTTGFYRRVTDIILERLDWRMAPPFDASVCSDEVTQGRPAPYMIFRAMEATGTFDVRRVAKVGDTALDLMAGRNAGTSLVVGVLSGASTREQLAVFDQAVVVPGVVDLPQLLA
jgi:phosphonatase-like hydrolase